jgi:hypothetical protein
MHIILPVPVSNAWIKESQSTLFFLPAFDLTARNNNALWRRGEREKVF